MSLPDRGEGDRERAWLCTLRSRMVPRLLWWRARYGGWLWKLCLPYLLTVGAGVLPPSVQEIVNVPGIAPSRPLINREHRGGGEDNREGEHPGGEARAIMAAYEQPCELQ
eukprot:1995901-Amphidinium_carterae.1